MVGNIKNNPYVLSANRIHTVLESYNKGETVTLGLWHKLKDFFRANSKEAAIKDLLNQLNIISPHGDIHETNSRDILKLLRDNARPEDLSKFNFKISHNVNDKNWSYAILINGHELNKREGISYDDIRAKALLFTSERVELAENIVSKFIDTQNMTTNYSDAEVDTLRAEVKKIIGRTVDTNKIGDLQAGTTIKEADLHLIYNELTKARETATKESPNSLLSKLDIKYETNSNRSQRVLTINGQEIISCRAPLRDLTLRPTAIIENFNKLAASIVGAPNSSTDVFTERKIRIYAERKINFDEDGDEIPPPPPRLGEGNDEIPPPPPRLDEGDDDIPPPPFTLDEGDNDMPPPPYTLDEGNDEIPPPPPRLDEGDDDMPPPPFTLDEGDNDMPPPPSTLDEGWR